MVIKHRVYIPFLDTMRMLHIYLPQEYETSHQSYPVLYMFDGHNLFYDEDATFGTSWDLKTWLDVHHYPLIIIGIECNHEGFRRLEEFTPFDFFDKQIGEIHAQGKQLMEWIVHDLKKAVDHHFRTLKGRKYTGIGGSSMGGLMALYSILHHNDIFSRAACLSPHLTGLLPSLQKEIEITQLCKNSRMYISWGSDEFRSKNQLAKSCNTLFRLTAALQNHRIQVYPTLIFKGRHSEASWRREVNTFLPYLFDERIEPLCIYK